MSEPDGEGLLRILRLLEKYEDGWLRGEPIPLEALLREADRADRPELLRQALRLELHHRRRHGGSPVVDEYLKRWPDDTSIIRAAFEETTVTLPPDRDEGSSPTEPSAGSDAPAPGDAISKYVVIRRLGAGGQASALLAREPELGRLVVLKRYHTSPRDPRVDGALQDGKALVRLRSRCTPHCYGLERHGDDLILVMEYIPGRNLSEVIKAGLPPARDAARLIEQVAEGVEAVHACGLVHRDIKPANIVVGDDGAPRLVDFGLAAHLGSAALEAISGTPQYMAPEQARGQWERIDGRTDVYGLGAVLYALLTGQPPHSGATIAEALEHARLGVVAPPRELNPSIPRGLERIALKALAADPAQRYASAAELRRALRDDRIGLRRRVAAVLAGLAVLALVVAALIGTRWTRGGAWFPGRSADRPIRVTAFAVGRFVDRGEGQPPHDYGILGERSLEAAEGDLVRVSAALSEPAYCFLVALNPDGSIQLCYPPGPSGTPDETVAPPAVDRVEYPASTERYFSLTDGRGQQAFVLFAAREPLPPFEKWRARLEETSWADQIRSGAAGGVWDFDDQGIRPIRPSIAGARGTEVTRAPHGLAELRSSLMSRSQVATFRGVAFPVR